MAGLLAGGLLGGPWLVIAPAVGFLLGLAGDVRMHKHGHVEAGVHHG